MNKHEKSKEWLIYRKFLAEKAGNTEKAEMLQYILDRFENQTSFEHKVMNIDVELDCIINKLLKLKGGD